MVNLYYVNYMCNYENLYISQSTALSGQQAMRIMIFLGNGLDF